MKHTPGPWIAPEEMFNLVLANKDWHEGLFVNGLQITVSLHQGEAQARADALLVAAAPEMLEVLESILSFMDKHNKLIIREMDVTAIRSAIKKARGEK